MTAGIDALLGEGPVGDALIIVPPFASADRPSYGAHILQTCAAAAGFTVDVLYANLSLAQRVGLDPYYEICYGPGVALIGERLFAAAAHDLEPLGPDAERLMDMAMILGEERARSIDLGVPLPDELTLSLDHLREMEALMSAWADEVADAVAARGYAVVGCTTTFEQTNAALSILRRIKERAPETITLIGGANCEGDMGRALAEIAPYVDHVFSGESEVTFPRFLAASATAHALSPRFIPGAMFRDLDTIAAPDYSQYLRQIDAVFTEPDENARVRDSVWLTYETSRGCWWGQKSHCTFCGLNGESMAFREKSPDKVIDDLTHLYEATGVTQVFMVDNIMPHTYHAGLVPRLAELEPRRKIFYEQKANLSLEKLLGLRDAGINSIQPGIEALSSDLLKRMAKGVKARQNLMLLRNSRALGIDVHWNLLWGFPGESVGNFEETLELVRLMHHLQPPKGLYHLSIDRFSPYHGRPQEYGMTNLQPMASYAAVYPPGADVDRLGYHFVAEYETETYRNLNTMRALAEEIGRWHACWKDGSTSSRSLRITSFGSAYILHDSRGLTGRDTYSVLEKEEAEAALISRPYRDDAPTRWALAGRYGAVVDSWFVSLVTAPPALLQSFDTDSTERRRRAGVRAHPVFTEDPSLAGQPAAS